MASERLLRIGELSKRSGASPELLRAWERRYGLLRPERSAGGLRLYSAADLERVQLMRRHLEDGFAAAEAAALALGGDEPAEARDVAAPALRTELADALEDFDEPRAQAVIDRLLATVTLDRLLGDALLPYLNELGERWERGEVSVAQEHFASSVVRGRLLGLARGWGLGVGPLAVLACVPGERHDLGLIAFGVALRERGWRIAYLGSDCPLETAAEASDRVDASALVLSSVSRRRVRALRDQLEELADRRLVALGGAGAAAAGSAETGIVSLAESDPVAGAQELTEALTAAAR